MFKKYLPDLWVVVAFVLISFFYFSSATLDGRELSQHDSLAAVGQGQEQRDYMARHEGKPSRWINSMFSGMPSYQMAPSYKSSKPKNVAKRLYSLYLPRYIALVFVMLLGFYILMRAFGANYLTSALGAIGWAFSSYFFIIIAAGHIWKFETLAYIPPTIAGIVLAYRKKYLPGALLIMLFVTFQISSNHIQMSYYFMIVMLAIAIAYLVEAIKQKTIPDFLKSTGIIVVAGLIGVATNAGNLYHTYEYSKETMRGKSELSHHGTENKTKSGLEKDYITAWSYGIGETWTLLVPNAKGGASVPLSKNKTAMKKADPNYRQLYAQIGQYWGNQPGTSGPVYVGAFVLTLFILALFIVKGPMKWALLAATVLSIMLAWGKNFMGLTDFFIDHVPMYNKFRAVASILVVAEFTIPLLAALAIKRLLETSKEERKMLYRHLWISAGLTGGIALLFAVTPKLFFSSFVSSFEMQQLQSLPAAHIQPVLKNLEQMRIAMFTADAWRSLLFIAIGVVLLWLFLKDKLKAQWSVGAIVLLCLVDMWSVNKRYLNDNDFTPKSENVKAFLKTPADEIILQDTASYYRVLNMATSTFNDGITPYWHKCIGGYHAAKLRRYQDLIDVHIGKEMQALQADIIQHQGAMDSLNAEKFKVLNMLNTKWIILSGQDGQQIPLKNQFTQGNAWFVDSIRFVDTPDEEIDALSALDLHREAVADKAFEPVLSGFTVSAHDSTSSIRLKSYDSNILTYNVNAKKPELAVFSEIYYPRGWQITIDGKPAEMLRANYTLRALPIPPGKHEVVFKFAPKSIHVTDTIAFVALFIILLTMLWVAWQKFGQQRKAVS